ncbi:MAG: type II toxin-antitoxin system HicB family antitoxin [Christensenellaceae bacterium]|jgi:predicted HicB family RNase H-like nuclease|nr:type II toxin-antitoxin system HicB family antitoxin [Christensenellaceae bacterium]
MSNRMSYKGYVGSVEFSEADATFYGKAVGIKALLSFEGASAAELVDDFHSVVDEYLEYCAEKGIKPEKPFKGSFNVRVGEELHRQAALAASAKGVSLNALVEDALRRVVN